ncbi:MAG: helicase-related protein, partial [Dehalococcoidia bacterium]
VRAHRSTLIFVNNRRLAERLAARLNEIAGEELLRTHHGSMSPDQRTEVEELLKSGRLPGLVCTSSLELGIDMGAIDLVVMVESPKSVASALQRVGRAGHQADTVSVGRLFPKFRGDLLECAVLTTRMRDGLIESTRVPRLPLDVLAQQIVAMGAVDAWTVEDLERTLRRAYSFSDLTREALENVLEMLAGHYPSDEFAELRPRIIWDRDAGTIESRRDARTVAVVNSGTIPDRGLYGVFLGEGGPRVGELDEEMVYESRAGETFVLGASTWRIEQITTDRVIVSPAPGEPGKMPFWKGDGVGRPLEFGKAIGAFTREIASLPEDAAVARLRDENALDELAAANLVSYVQEQREATRALPTDRSIVVEHFRDELGDWRVVILTPFGARVHAPWALALEARFAEQSGFDVQTVWSDDGIAIRFAGAEEPTDSGLLFPEPEEVEELVVGQLANSTLFAAHFRESAGRALLLPRRRPGARMPLWQQRQRSASLMAVASRYGSFPIILETYRECLRDVFDLPGLVEILSDVRSRAIDVTSVQTGEASPFSRSLLFDYVAAYMYEGDAPLAERRAQALALDRALLRDLLGEDELRELLDAESLTSMELELQRLTEGRGAPDADRLHDLLRALGDLSPDEVAARIAEPDRAVEWLALLESTQRACLVRIGGEERWIAMEDAGRYRDAIGVAPPLGAPEAFLKPSNDALEGLLLRFARTHVPFVAAAPAGRWRLPQATVLEALRTLSDSGAVLHGAFLPGGSDREWCEPDVLRRVKSRSLARLRKDVEPVPGDVYARFLARWHGIGSDAAGISGLRQALPLLEGAPVAASILEGEVLSARVKDYRPELLDELGALGEVAWVGRGKLGRDDGRLALVRRENLHHFSWPAPDDARSELAGEVLTLLERRGAMFFADIARELEAPARDLIEAVWELAWAGLASNDTFAPARAATWSRRRHGAARPGRAGSIPAEVSGRWFALSATGRSPAGERAHATALALLERYGVVVRESVQADGVPGGFAGVYPLLKAMEEAGKVRRGYFIEGLGAAQFALPGAVDRLRAERLAPDEPAAVVLPASDPANPYGASLPWPRADAEDRRPLQRAAGALISLVDGLPAVYVERGRRSLLTLPAAGDETLCSLALAALAEHPTVGAGGWTIERIDGEPAGGSKLAPRLREIGFVDGYKGLVKRGGSRRAGR